MPRGRFRNGGATLPPAPQRADLLAAQAPSVTTIDDLAGLVEGSGGLLEQAGEGSIGQARQQGRRVNTVQHTTSAKVTLYDINGEAHVVPLMNLSMCLSNGLSVACPKCGGQHDDDSPNACPAQEKLLFTICPICATYGVERRIYEARVSAEAGSDQVDSDDPHYVKPQIPERKAREQQVSNRLTLHMQAYHKTEAAHVYGLGEASG